MAGGGDAQAPVPAPATGGTGTSVMRAPGSGAPMKSKRKPLFPSFLDLNKVVIGIVSIIAIAAACLGAFAIGSLGLFKHTYSMSGVFDNANGIGKGAEVHMSGVVIGTVSGIHPDYQKGQVIITWKINKGVHLGNQTRADLNLANLLGGEYVKLTSPGAPQHPYMEELPAVDKRCEAAAAGGSTQPCDRRIPRARTTTTFTVNGVLGTAATDIQQLDIPTLSKVLVDLTTAFNATKPNLDPLLLSLEKVSAALNQRDQDFRQLLANTQQATATLAAKNQAIGQIVDSASALLNALTSRRDQLSNLLGSGSDAVIRLSNVISIERDKLDTIIGDLHVAIAAATRNLPAVNQGFAWMGPTFTDLSHVADFGPFLEAVATSFNPNLTCLFLTTFHKPCIG
jgi:phospholipid/cholesterol/gamma-HCH transport system substrate-binding protein